MSKYSKLIQEFKHNDLDWYIDEKNISYIDDSVIRFNVKIAFKKANNKNKQENIYEKTIKWWTKSKYYHTEMVIGNMWISSTIGNGTHIYRLVSLRDNYDYVSKQVTLTIKQYIFFIYWLNANKNKKYDILGILLSQTIPLRYDDKDKWFCSEMCVRISQLLYIEEVMLLRPQTVSPGRLAKIFNLER